MNDLAFFDSNVLVYAEDSSEPRKQKQARTLIERHLESETLVVSLQVLQEYFYAATRKLGLAAEAAQERVERLIQTRRVVCFQPGDVINAIELHRLRQISFWDALIAHAARLAGAAVLYSEDLQDGGRLGGMRIVNPFADTASRKGKS